MHNSNNKETKEFNIESGLMANNNDNSTFNSALIKQSIRKYGNYKGNNRVNLDLSKPIHFLVLDMKYYDNLPLNYGTYCPEELKNDNIYTDPEQNFERYNNSKSGNVVMFGRTEEGYSISARVPFNPFIYLSVGKNWSRMDSNLLCNFLSKNINIPASYIKIKLEFRKRLYGWVPDKVDNTKTEKIKVLKISVPNRWSYYELIKTMKVRKLNIPGIYFTSRPHVWEKKVDIIHKFCDTSGVIPSGWVSINQYKDPGNFISHCQIEIESQLMFVSPNEKKTTTPPLLLASVDGEMFSSRNKFPNPRLERDHIITIGTSLWRIGDYKYINKSPEEIKEEIHSEKTSIQKKLRVLDISVKKFESEKLYFQTIKSKLGTYEKSLKEKIFKKKEADFINKRSDLETKFKNIETSVKPIRKELNIQRFAFCLKETDPVEDCNVIWCCDEQELLKKWRDFMSVDVDPDIVIGYNILGFDWKYFAQRANQVWIDKNKHLDLDYDEHSSQQEDQDETEAEKKFKEKYESMIESENKKSSESGGFNKLNKSFLDYNRFFNLSKIWNEECVDKKTQKIRVKVFKSNAYGESKSYRFDMTGRVTIDLLIYIRRGFKLRSYKLGAVSQHFLKDDKIDLKPKLMFQYWMENPQKRSMIAEYCAKDCDLPIKLMTNTKISTIPNLIEMSKVTITPLTAILEKGQQIKVFNQLVWFGHHMGFVMNDHPWNIQQGFEGAIVIDPVTGWYNEPIATLDFASLYPSIMQNKNLCYATLVLEEKYKNLPGVEYNIIKVGDRTHTFVSKKIEKGVLVEMEEHLLKTRRSAKKLMKEAKDPDTYAMLNGKQLALKVSCNSVFGFTGTVQRGMYPCPAIAESITATGRHMIEETKRIVCEMIPGTEVIYGDTDSVMVKFPVSKDEDGMAKSFELGEEVAKKVTEVMGESIELEMEKVYFPYLLFGKKRYAGLMFEKIKGKILQQYIDNKGIEVVRRDWSELTGEVMRNLLDYIFLDRDIEKSKQYVKSVIQDMVDDKIPIEKFILSKSLRGKYKNPDTQPHVALVKKMAKRNPGSEPQVGDRVQYVIKRVKKKNPKLFERTEDPEYMINNPKNVKIDYLYYLEKQLEKPLHKLFDQFMENPGDLFEKIKRQVDNENQGFSRNGLMDYLNFKKPEKDEKEIDSFDGTCDVKISKSYVAKPKKRAPKNTLLTNFISSSSSSKNNNTPCQSNLRGDGRGLSDFGSEGVNLSLSHNNNNNTSDVEMKHFIPLMPTTMPLFSNFSSSKSKKSKSKKQPKTLTKLSNTGKGKTSRKTKKQNIPLPPENPKNLETIFLSLDNKTEHKEWTRRTTEELDKIFPNSIIPMNTKSLMKPLPPVQNTNSRKRKLESVGKKSHTNTVQLKKQKLVNNTQTNNSFHLFSEMNRKKSKSPKKINPLISFF